MITSRKAFAFSLFALFLSLILFSFSVFIYEDEQYTQADSFKEARLGSVNSEIIYFREVFLKGSFEFALYQANDALLNWTDKNPQLLSQNPELFQELLFEAVVNGSINGSSQESLDGFSLSEFIATYKNSFENQHRASIDVEIHTIRFYEETPYHMSADGLFGINVSMEDSLANWTLNDTLSVQTSLYGLEDPEFLLYLSENRTIEPIEFFSNQANWTRETFNASLNNTYSTVYLEPVYNVTIGLSFMKRLLNFSKGSIEGVSASWNFDEDPSLGFLDLVSQERSEGFFGNSLGLYTFDTAEQNATHSIDLSHYGNHALKNGVDCSLEGINGESCFFDGVDDNITLSSTDSAFFDQDFSLSFWMGTSTQPSSDQWILSKGGFSTPHLIMALDTEGDFFVLLDDAVDSASLSSRNPLNNSVFHHIVLSVDRDSELRLYVDGHLEDSERGDFSSLDLTTISPLSLGLGEPDQNNPYEGFIDELVLYKGALGSSEVSRLFESRSVVFLDQEDSLFEEALVLDGRGDYFNTTKDIDATSEFGLEFWLRAEAMGNGSSQGLLSKRESGAQEWVVELEDDGVLNFEGYDVADGSSFSFQSQSTGSLRNNTWYHIYASFDGAESQLFINGILNSSDSALGGALVDTSTEILFGVGSSDLDASFFKGNIDEVRVYNRSLSEREVLHHFHNFKAAVKSCCNYITLIEPNQMGFTGAEFDTLNVSYLSRSFFDYRERQKSLPSILLFELDNLTSDDSSEEHFNFVVDMCGMQAFSLFDYYNNTPRPQSLESDECSKLIALGVH